MIKNGCSVALLVVALSYLIIPPGAQERDASVRFEPEASMTQWKVVDEFASMASCEQGRVAIMFKASQLRSDDAIRLGIAESHSREGVQKERRAFDAVALGVLLARCVSAIGPSFDHTNLL
jgi:hypothetical protein